MIILDSTVMLYGVWTHSHFISMTKMLSKLTFSFSWRSHFMSHQLPRPPWVSNIFQWNYGIKMGPNTKQQDSIVHDSHFKKKFRSLDPMVQILWPSEIFLSKLLDFSMYFSRFWIFDRFKSRLEKTTKFIFKLLMNVTYQNLPI